MSAELMEAYETLPEDQKQEVLDFVMFLKGRGDKIEAYENSRKADVLMSAFEQATVNVPISWTREEIHERK